MEELRIVVKRNGDKVPYQTKKIYAAIAGANKDSHGEMSAHAISNAVMQTDVKLQGKREISVEHIQDMVEETLMDNKYFKTAKQFIIYRDLHDKRRNASQKLMEDYNDLLFSSAESMDLKRDNANINADSSMGIMLKLGTEGAKSYVDNYFLTPEELAADKEGFIHIHDKDFSMITFNCCQIDLGKLLKHGFNTGHGFLREPNSIRAAASLACIVIQSNQNEMYGGQSINALDYALAPYVTISFKKAFARNFNHSYRIIFNRAWIKRFSKSADASNEKVVKVWMKDLPEVLDAAKYVQSPIFTDDESDLISCGEYQIESLQKLAKELYSEKYDDEIMDIICEAIHEAYFDAVNDVEEETKQAMEAMIHNFNTLHSRAGAQCPFSSINFGMDTSPEGRLVTKWTLEAIYAGLGRGETSIFPISVFQLKAGVNYNPGDPNYDLFQRACEVSAKRLFPNFVNLDAPYNLKYYKPGDYNSYVSAMGCRTRVMSNVNGPEISGSRGNFAFTTLNLPMMALEAIKDVEGAVKGYMEYSDHEAIIKRFYELVDQYALLSKSYMERRYEVIASKEVKNFPFLMGQGVWLDSEKLEPEDEIREVLKHASLSIGFCGLAECLVALAGAHHGVSEYAQRLGLEIVSHIRALTDKFTEDTHMNWTCFGTPAESTAGSFARACKKRFGQITGVCDREYLTNSSHVPVYYKIKAMDKIRIEAPYHALENAGHIAYVEMDGDPTKNVKAFEKIVRAMHDADMGYFSINHPVDRDPVCGYTGLIENECPHCHRKEVETGRFTIKRMK